MSRALDKVSDKLLELSEKYGELLPKFHEEELKYISLKAKYMREQYPNFGSQPTRDAAVQELLEQTPEYVEYNRLLPEMKVLEMQIRIYLQISKNLNFQ